MEGPFEETFSFRPEKALEKSTQKLDPQRQTVSERFHLSNSCSPAMQLCLLATGLSRLYTEKGV